MPRNHSRSVSSGEPLSGKNTWMMVAARAQTRNTTVRMTANTMALPSCWRASPMLRRSDTGSLRSTWMLIEYSVSASQGPTKTKPVITPRYRPRSPQYQVSALMP